jgi:hypothetical protein
VFTDLIKQEAEKLGKVKRFLLAALGLIFLLLFPLLKITQHMYQALIPYPTMSTTIEINGPLKEVEHGYCSSTRYILNSNHCGQELIKLGGYNGYGFLVNDFLLDDIEEIGEPIGQEITLKVNQSQLENAQSYIKSGEGTYRQDVNVCEMQSRKSVYFSLFNEEGKKKFFKHRILNWFYTAVWLSIILWFLSRVRLIKKA